jgi:hypothetical protein
MKTLFQSPRHSIKCIALLIGLSAAPLSQGATIFWGSLPSDTFYDSSGNSLGSSFTFEVGTFAGGFVPTSGNMADWSANWDVFDRIQAGAQWTANTSYIDSGSGVTHQVDGSSSSLAADPSSIFAEGTQAYLWVYNSTVYGSGSEWALLTDVNKGPGNNSFSDWQFPATTQQSGESYDWQIRDLDTAVFGGAASTQGPGNFSVDPGTFTLQTHAIPEPGSALLLGMAGAFMFRRIRSAGRGRR